MTGASRIGCAGDDASYAPGDPRGGVGGAYVRGAGAEYVDAGSMYGDGGGGGGAT
jgi:hypothetical protein